MNLPVSLRFDGAFYDVCALLEVLLNLFSPKAENNPALFFEYLVDFPIAFHIPLDLRYPKISMGLDIVFAMFPVIPVPELAVAEYGNFLSDKNNVRFTWNRFDVFTITKAA